MILKLLLVGAVIYIVYVLFFKKKTIQTSNANKTNRADTKQQANEMVQCATCGVYCELDEAILSASTYYCSPECLTKAS